MRGGRLVAIAAILVPLLWPTVSAAADFPESVKRFHPYSDVKTWSAQISYRRTMTSAYKLGALNVSGYEIIEGQKTFEAGNLESDGQYARWYSDNTGHETASVDAYVHHDAAEFTEDSYRTGAGSFDHPNNWVELDYVAGTFRAGSAGGEPVTSQTRLTATSHGVTTHITGEQGFAPLSGQEGPVEGMPLPVPKQGEGVAIIGGRSWTEQPEIPPDTPEDLAAMVVGTTVTWEVTWTLTPVYDDTVLVVDIDDYERWIPKGNEIAFREGNRLNVTARLESKGGGPTAKKAEWMRFELLETSREPGVALNGPTEPDPPTYDLQFTDDVKFPMVFDDNALPPRIRGRQILETVEGSYSEVPVVIASFDYGSWSTLRVTAKLDDGRIVAGYLRGKPDVREITIPRRRIGSYIAEKWKEDRRGAELTDASDAEHTPGNAWDGDGFSLYEEYRGFFEGGLHRRFDPSRKELCVLDKVKGPSLRGFHAFERATWVRVRHQFEPREFREDRVMNPNRSDRSPRSSREHQHGLIVVSTELSFRSYTDSDVDIPATVPKHVRSIEISSSATANGGSTMVSWPYGAGVKFVADLAAWSIAHELTHACGVPHHGSGDPGDVSWARDTSTTPHRIVETPTLMGIPIPAQPTSVPIRVYLENGSEISADTIYFDDPLVVKLAKYTGGEHSGDVGCLMRYNVATAYIHPRPPHAARVLVLASELVGMHLCEAPDGTEYNAATRTPWPRYGDAAAGLGNCRPKVCVRDSAKP